MRPRRFQRLNLFADGIILDENVEQLPRGFGDLSHGIVKSLLVCPRRFAASAHLAHKLQRGGGYFFAGCYLLAVA